MKMPPPRGRAHPFDQDPTVLIGPVWKGCGEHGWQPHGPRCRINGRWLPALRSSRRMYGKGVRADNASRRLMKLQRIAERFNLERWTGCPF
jgi:hypothetical protein